MAKRLFDIAVSFLLLLIASPVFLVIAISVKLSSPGPVFFRQERLGYKQKRFLMWKFRTMKAGSPAFEWVKQRNDPRITKAGNILRPTYLDELPQLWNVLLGDMSLVGPRPQPLKLVEEHSAQLREKHGSKAERYLARFDVRPGITGPVQVLGRNWVLSHPLEESLEIDINYVQRQSFIGDLKILRQTISVVCKGHGM